MLYNVYVNFEIKELTRSVIKRGKEKTRIFKNIDGYYNPMVKAKSAEAAEQKIREKINFLAKEEPQELYHFFSAESKTNILPCFTENYTLHIKTEDITITRCRACEMSAQDVIKHFSITEIIEEYPQLALLFSK
jgi:hypothetical protein